MKPDKPHRPPWLRLLGLALIAHLLFCVQRLETKSLPARIDEIQEFRENGAIRFHLSKSPENAAVLQMIAENTPEECVVLFKGEDHGSMELAVGLLSPRLLYAESGAAPGVSMIHGLPVARAKLPNLGEGTLVLVGVDRETLRLELRR
jgi:hypothetical protein